MTQGNELKQIGEDLKTLVIIWINIEYPKIADIVFPKL